MAASPIFVGTPRFVSLIVNNSNAGDPAYAAPTTIATILTMGASGGRIESIRISPVGTNAATSVRLFIDTVGTGGTANRLIYDAPMALSTSTTVAALAAVVWSPGLVLPADAVLRATVANTAVTNGVCISVEYGEF